MTAVKMITVVRALITNKPKFILFRVLIYKISEFKMPPKMGKTRKSSNDKRSEFLGPSKELLQEDDLPTLRCCLRYGMYLREKAMKREDELEVHIMAKYVYKKVLPLYFKANAKLSPPVIMTEAVFAQKLVRVWNDVNTIFVSRRNGPI